MRPGKIYVLRNEQMRELLVKVGKTLRTSEDRATELGKASGVPGRFHTLIQEDVADVDHAEKLVHRRLSAYRLQPNREFFQVPYELAIRTVFDTCREVNKHLEETVKRVRIDLGTSADGAGDARRLQALLGPYRGGAVQVLVTYSSGSAGCEVVLGESWKVTFSPQLVRDLYDWLGEQRVLFVRWPEKADPGRAA